MSSVPYLGAEAPAKAEAEIAGWRGHGGKRPGAGRPRTTDATLSIRCLESELERWRERAAEVGQTLSAWVRERLG